MSRALVVSFVLRRDIFGRRDRHGLCPLFSAVHRGDSIWKSPSLAMSRLFRAQVVKENVRWVALGPNS